MRSTREETTMTSNVLFFLFIYILLFFSLPSFFVTLAYFGVCVCVPSIHLCLLIDNVCVFEYVDQYFPHSNLLQKFVFRSPLQIPNDPRCPSLQTFATHRLKKLSHVDVNF